jgi:hypothetical protein
MSYLILLLGGVWPRFKNKPDDYIPEKRWELVNVKTPISGVNFYVLVATNKPAV